MRNKKMSVRFSEEEEKMIEQLKKAFFEQHHMELNDSDLIRQALRYMYTEANKTGKEN